MTSWLITGGAGFIGSHLVDVLLARGDRCVVLDDCSTGSLRNLAQHAGNANCQIMHGSVCDELLVDEACEKIDGIIHLAAAVGVRRILDRQVRSIVTNVRGTEVVLQAAAAHGNVPVFVASTSEVYGKGAQVPFREQDDSVLGATHLHRWSYACSKMMDEFLALAWYRERGLPVTIGRFFNTTGPRQSPAYGMVLPTFCKLALAQKNLVVHGDGEQSRCFLHVEDCVEAVVRLIDSGAGCGRVVNIGGTEEVTMRALAERVIAQADSSSQIELQSYEQAFPEGGFEDMRRRVPDTTRLRELTNWTPRHQLDAIISGCLRTVAASA